MSSIDSSLPQTIVRRIPQQHMGASRSFLSQSFFETNCFWASKTSLALMPEMVASLDASVIYSEKFRLPYPINGKKYNLDDLFTIFPGATCSYGKVFFPSQIRCLIENQEELQVLREDGQPNIFAVVIETDKKKSVIVPLMVSYIQQMHGRNWAIWISTDGSVSQEEPEHIGFCSCFRGTFHY